MQAPKILVVDDYAGIVELLELQLRFLGWDVTTARSGQQALAMLESIRPD